MLRPCARWRFAAAGPLRIWAQKRPRTRDGCETGSEGPSTCWQRMTSRNGAPAAPSMCPGRCALRMTWRVQGRGEAGWCGSPGSQGTAPALARPATQTARTRPPLLILRLYAAPALVVSSANATFEYSCPVCLGRDANAVTSATRKSGFYHGNVGTSQRTENLDSARGGQHLDLEARARAFSAGCTSARATWMYATPSAAIHLDVRAGHHMRACCWESTGYAH